MNQITEETKKNVIELLANSASTIKGENENNVSSLENIAFDLDTKVNEISNFAETLSDVSELLNDLKEDMTTDAHRGDEKYYFHFYHRQVRVVAELMRYTVRELNEEVENSHKLTCSLFDYMRAEKITSSRQAIEVNE